MVETTAHLVDHVIPRVPVRQWVLSFPIPLRLLLAAHPELLAPVLQIVHRVIATFLIKQAGLKRAEAATGAVTLIQRFGSAANLNIHLHCLLLDGVYRITEGAPVFHAGRAPTGGELQALLSRIIRRLMKFLTRKGFLIEEQGMSYLADTDPDLALGPLRAAACTYRIALGPRAGQKVLSLQTVPTREPPLTPVRCVDEQGFSLHAEVCCAAHQRHKLEHLCRYITRPAIANERLTLNRAGNVVLQLKSPYHDGTTHIVMSPLEFMQRLAALVSRPRLHLIASSARRAGPIPGPAFASMACSHLTLNCVPRLSRAPPTQLTIQPGRARQSRPRRQPASVGPSCSSGCSISTSNTAPTAAAP